MMINVEVQKNSNENNLSLLRRFTKRVQGSGVLPRVRSIRYKIREDSFYKRKKKTLEKLERKATLEEMIKLGKIKPKEQYKNKK